MTIVVQNSGTKRILEVYLGVGPLTLKLFSNNKTPAIADLAAEYTAVSGGGYADKTLTAGNWSVEQGNPSIALYNTDIDFQFTGAPSPATVYGYYIIDSTSMLISSERFPVVPFVPIDGSLIRFRPRITSRNQV